jgi:outer membrane protein assembly factor BamB
MALEQSFTAFFKPLRHYVHISTAQAAIISVALVLGLTACSSGTKRIEPAPLAANVPLIGVKQVWAARMGEQLGSVAPTVVGNLLVMSSVDGTVATVDGATGRDLWRTSLGEVLSTGAGSDGQKAAVVTRSNDVVVLEAAKTLWRAKLSAQVFTTPLVAGGRVFVLAADRSVTAFDATTGRKLWTQQRPSEPLVLKQPGTLMAVGDTLVAGVSGRLVGLNPNNGSLRWEAPIASPRGTNDIERLVDIVARNSRTSDVVCARAFQSAVGCVNAARGTVLWTRPANSADGVHGDDALIVGTESDGKVIAWRSADGERAWTNERLQYRDLTAPLVLSRSIVLGDSTGLVHFLSREDGSALTRLPTDSSGVSAGPVLAGETLVVVTRSGGVYGFAPE